MNETQALLDISGSLDSGLRDVADAIYDGLRIHRSKAIERREYFNVTDGLFAIAEAINELSRAIRAGYADDGEVS